MSLRVVALVTLLLAVATVCIATDPVDPIEALNVWLKTTPECVWLARDAQDEPKIEVLLIDVLKGRGLFAKSNIKAGETLAWLSSSCIINSTSWIELPDAQHWYDSERVDTLSMHPSWKLALLGVWAEANVDSSVALSPLLPVSHMVNLSDVQVPFHPRNTSDPDSVTDSLQRLAPYWMAQLPYPRSVTTLSLDALEELPFTQSAPWRFPVSMVYRRSRDRGKELAKLSGLMELWLGEDTDEDEIERIYRTWWSRSLSHSVRVGDYVSAWVPLVDTVNRATHVNETNVLVQCNPDLFGCRIVAQKDVEQGQELFHKAASADTMMGVWESWLIHGYMDDDIPLSMEHYPFDPKFLVSQFPPSDAELLEELTQRMDVVQQTLERDAASYVSTEGVSLGMAAQLRMWSCTWSQLAPMVAERVASGDRLDVAVEQRARSLCTSVLGRLLEVTPSQEALEARVTELDEAVAAFQGRVHDPALAVRDDSIAEAYMRRDLNRILLRLNSVLQHALDDEVCQSLPWRSPSARKKKRDAEAKPEGKEVEGAPAGGSKPDAKPRVVPAHALRPVEVEP